MPRISRGNTVPWSCSDKGKVDFALYLGYWDMLGAFEESI